jgi:hypothetical protein
MVYAEVGTLGVATNVNVLPPSDVKGVILAVEEDATVKSAAIPVVAPVAPETKIVQGMLELTRRGDGGRHISDVEVVTIPTTGKMSGLFFIGFPPTKTRTENAEDKAVGIVENEKVEPPLLEIGTMDVEADDDAAKSEASPVVAPEFPETVKTHVTGNPIRAGEEHDKRVLAVVGTP